MQLTNEIFTARPDEIDASGSHLFWAHNDLESLTESIAEFGQTTPVLVCESDRGLALVAGHARLTALRKTGGTALARMVEDATDMDRGLLYLADNAHRLIDDGMRLKALRYFATIADERTLRDDILPRLGVKSKSKDATLFLSWLGMDATWQTLLESGNVPLAAAAPLARMTGDERAAVETLFTGYSWSRSNAVNVLTWLFEAAKMSGGTVREVMNRAGMPGIIGQGLSPKDAIARLSAAARLARYPELTKLQDRFTTLSGEITAGTRWRMVQPNNFETGGSELTVQVKDANQLARAVKDLEALSGSPAWNSVWKLGGPDD